MKFGVREIVDVVFKATENGQKVGTKTFQKYQPVFMIDTATTSSLEQATTVVYAQGGKGYARLIAWEGEKTMTFTVTDALMSPMGLAVLTGAGLISPADTPDKSMHVHMTINKNLDADGTATVTLGDLQEETGLNNATKFAVCATIDAYATKLDGSGAGIDWFDNVDIDGDSKTTDYINVDSSNSAVFIVNDEKAKNATVQLDFYLIMNNPNAVQEIVIEPGSFGGYFYVEAQTLFRREDSGQDMAAEIIIPKAKIQSAFTFTMAATGDPSTFDFVMDAMPGYTRFDSTKKIMCKFQVLGTDNTGTEESSHTHDPADLPNPVSPEIEGFNKATADVVSASAVASSQIKPIDPNNQAAASINGDKKKNIVIEVAGGTDNLISIEPRTGWGAAKWVALDYNTGEASIEGLNYINRGTTTVLGPEDVADATDLGLEAGHLVVWVKADLAKTTPATFTLEKDGNVVDVVITAKDVAAG